MGRDLSISSEFSYGVHTWELIFPICITGVEFGVKSTTSGKKFCRKFKTTTPRYVSVTLDVDRQKITYRLNKDPFTDKVINIDNDGPITYPSSAQVRLMSQLYLTHIQEFCHIRRSW